MENKTFDILRTVCEVALPALSTAYFGLAQLWHLPLAEEVCGTLAIAAAFIGAFINVKRSQYNQLEVK